MKEYTFPEGFQWGTATASYQIEGAVKQDGRGESIWDRFCLMPGNILNNDIGDIACDHYNLFRDDVKLMKELGHRAYRFSISWSRILPAGRGEVSEKGLKFYSELVDELLSAGIEPFVTLYHWDLPQALQDIGGWTNSEMPRYFEEYCKIVFDCLGGRVKYWITLNEPICSSFKGYYNGVHAPGMRDFSAAMLASYNLLLGHGRVVKLFRETGGLGEIGITLNLSPRHPVTDSAEDLSAAMYGDAYANRWFIDPVVKGCFPKELLELYREKGIPTPEIKAGDLALMSQKIDFLGLNYYRTVFCRYKETWPLNFEEIVPDLPVTDRKWPITPEGLTEMLLRLKNEYGLEKIYITENGASYNDVVNTGHNVEDYPRIDYLRRHLAAVHEAIEKGVNVKGYFVWSLYDNFEWAFGYSSRFGIVFVDFKTRERIIKESGRWYRDICISNRMIG